jgi:hypothetical protein
MNTGPLIRRPASITSWPSRHRSGPGRHPRGRRGFDGLMRAPRGSAPCGRWDRTPGYSGSRGGRSGCVPTKWAWPSVTPSRRMRTTRSSRGQPTVASRASVGSTDAAKDVVARFGGVRPTRARLLLAEARGCGADISRPWECVHRISNRVALVSLLRSDSLQSSFMKNPFGRTLSPSVPVRSSSEVWIEPQTGEFTVPCKAVCHQVTL